MRQVHARYRGTGMQPHGKMRYRGTAALVTHTWKENRRRSVAAGCGCFSSSDTGSGCELRTQLLRGGKESN